MSKLELLSNKIKEARLNRDEVAKNLLLTMKGEFENLSKVENVSDDVLIEKIAKKMIKSANIVGTEDSKREVIILEEFMPKMLTEIEIRQNIGNMIDENPGKPFGFYMGSLMKSGQVDGNMAKNIITEMLS